MRELGSMTTRTKETKSVRHLVIQKPNEQDCTSETGKTASTYASSNATLTKESLGSFEANSKASSGFRGGFSDATMLSCYLKTQTSKFKQFQLSVEDMQINFYRFDSTDESIMTATPKATHSLKDVHVTCGATEPLENKQMMFPVKLNNYSTVKCCRQIYFDNEQDQQRCVDQLLQAQGFADQVGQYEFRAKPLQATPICAIKLAQHKVTGSK